MSTDAIADALLATCESSIKSLSQMLTSLRSINALHRLKEKTDVMEAFSNITSFAPFLVPPVFAPTPSATRDEPLVEVRTGDLDHTRKVLTDRLAALQKRRDQTAALTHTPVLPTTPSTLEDGRDDDLRPPSSQSTLQNFSILLPSLLDNYSDLLHGPRPSSDKLDEWRLQQAETRPLYSILVYFPILTSRRMWVTTKEREMVARIVLPSTGGDGVSTEPQLLSTEMYPRVRLLDRARDYDSATQNIVLVLDDNPGRLRAAQMRLLSAQRSYWADGNSSSLMKDEASIFVRTWEEKPIILVFSYSTSTSNSTRKIKEIRQDPEILAGAVFLRYPILARFQPLIDCHSKGGDGTKICRLPGGGGRFYYSPPTSYYTSSRAECHTLFVPLFDSAIEGSNEDLEDFCEDFASENSPFIFDKSLQFTITCDTLKDPSLPFRRLRWDL